MAEVSNDLIYETLKSVLGRIGRIDMRLDRIEDRMAHTGDLMTGMVKDQFSRNAEMTELERRVARIEDRLNLRDADT